MHGSGHAHLRGDVDHDLGPSPSYGLDHSGVGDVHLHQRYTLRQILPVALARLSRATGSSPEATTDSTT